MKKIKLHKLPLFTDEKGQLVPVELKEYIHWEPKRIYYAFNNKKNRGGHAHKLEKELFICVKGLITAKVHDGEKWYEYKLEAPGDAIYVDNMIWHEFTDFSEDAILLAVSSTNYNPEDYIRDFDQFLKLSSSA